MRSLLISIILFPIISFAGGSRVGCTVDFQTGDLVTQNHEVVFFQDAQNGLIKYSHGVLVNGEWQVQNLVTSAADIIQSSNVGQALSQSQIERNWVYVK